MNVSQTYCRERAPDRYSFSTRDKIPVHIQQHHWAGTFSARARVIDYNGTREVCCLTCNLKSASHLLIIYRKVHRFMSYVLCSSTQAVSLLRTVESLVHKLNVYYDKGNVVTKCPYEMLLSPHVLIVMCSVNPGPAVTDGSVGHPGGQWPKLGISWSEVRWSTRAQCPNTRY